MLAEDVYKRQPEARLNGGLEHRLPGNANISVPGLEGEAVRSLTAQFLQMWGILKEPEYEQFLTRPIPVPENAKGVADVYKRQYQSFVQCGQLFFIEHSVLI